jgi:LysM repeat protein
MIESQTELPAQEDGPAKTWARAEQISSSVIAQIEAKIQALAGNGGIPLKSGMDPLLDKLGKRSLFQFSSTSLARWLRTDARDGLVLRRYALHLVIVLLAVGVVAVSQVSIPQIDFRLKSPALSKAGGPTPAPELGTQVTAVPATNRGGGRIVGNNTNLFQAPVPHTIIPERDRMEIVTYTVQANDNVWSIANGFGLQVETIVWANPAVEKAPDLLSVGQVLTILPVDGMYYTVQPGDTLDKLANEYKAEASKIASFELNGLEEPFALTPGQKLVIPGGRKKIVPSNYYPMTSVGRAPAGAPKGSGNFAWPARGYLTQAFWSGHQGVDIGNGTGTPILAADAGYVVMAGRDTWGYGNQVLIDHGNGYLTRYAHLQKIGVTAGQTVTKNQQIGTMGSTGRSTGPHLHFEVIQGQVRRNPLGFLP